MVANTLGPQARTLGGALRQARETQNVSLRTHAKNLGVAASQLSYWENGARVPSIEDAASYLTALGIIGEPRDNILELVRNAKDPNWLTVGLPGIARQLDGILACERTANHVFEWSIGVIPGLLQTADYARAIIGDSPEGGTKVALRLSRRDALSRRDPLKLDAVLSELALRQVIGGKSVMVDQLSYLLSMAQLATVTIQVVPIGEGWHPGLAGPFVLYDFLAAPTILHLEHHRSGAFVYDEEDVGAYKLAAENVRETAMSPKRSLELIANVVNEMETTE